MHPSKVTGAELAVCETEMLCGASFARNCLRTSSLRVGWLAGSGAAPAPLLRLPQPQVASDARARPPRHDGVREGGVEESIKLFDAAEEADPRYATRLWQRGLSYYYADRFKDAKRQWPSPRTERHRGGSLHLLAMARTEGLGKARPQMIMGRDPRGACAPSRRSA